MPNFIYSLPGELVRAVEAALQLGLTDEESAAAASSLGDLAGDDDAPDPDPAQIVTAFEKAIGLGLDETDFEMATAAVRRRLDQYAVEEYQAFDQASDAHLEMAYEDRVSGLDQN